MTSAILKLVLRTSSRRSFNFLKCPRSSVLSTDLCPQIGTSNSCPKILSPSAASDCLAPAPPIGLLGRSRASARSGPGTRAGPTWAGPQRDKPGHCVTWPRRGGDVTRGRDHRPPALPPGPLPNRVSLFGVCRCARAPRGGCQGLRALTQRSPRSGRFAAMRVRPREVHRRRGLAQPPSLGSANLKDEEELCARVRSDARRRARRRVAMGLELRGAALLRGAFGSGSSAGPARRVKGSTVRGAHDEVASSERVEGAGLRRWLLLSGLGPGGPLPVSAAGR